MKKCAIVFISEQTSDAFGYTSFRSDHPILVSKKGTFYYIYGGENDDQWIPSYMIKEVIDIEEAEQLYPELFL